MRGSLASILGLVVSGGFVLYESPPDAPMMSITGRAGGEGQQRDRFWAAADQSLETLRRQWLHARFDEVLSATPNLRARLEPLAQVAGSSDRVVRLELLEASAALAYGRERDAVAAVRRALVEVPGLTLDPMRAPRKLVRLLDRERAWTARRQLEPLTRPVEASALVEPGDRAPRLRYADPVRVPARASRSLRPTITCRILIGPDGRVKRALVHRSRSALAEFEQRAQASVREFRFEPALRAGHPVAVWINWPVRFD